MCIRDSLYEMLRFIDETEALSLSEQADAAITQGSLLWAKRLFKQVLAY